MASFIIKINGYYLEWSTCIDAPITEGMSLEEFKEYYRDKYGWSSMEGLTQRLERVEEKGTSSQLHKSAEDTVDLNFAGPPKTKPGKRGNKKLTFEQIYQTYCLKEPYKGWLPDWFSNEEEGQKQDAMQ